MAIVELRRTAVVKLDVNDDAHQLLQQTIDRFKQAAQMAADDGWNGTEDGYIVTSKTELHDRTYDDVREATNELNADLVCAARNRAADALDSCAEKRKDGETPSKPRFSSDSVVYNLNAITYYDEYATLATVDGRIEAKYVLPDEDVPPTTYFSKEWEKREATLHHRDGDYYLHIAVVKETEKKPEDAENGTVLGVDLNVDGHLAVTSTGAFIGNADYLNHKRREYEKRRGQMQQAGTRSAHLTMKSLGGGFARWSEDYLHRVSKALVQEALAHDCTYIAFEKLKHIRKRISNASKFQQWAFRRIQEYTEYKAAEYGIAVEQIAPQYTSQRCSHVDCSFTHEDNRDGEEFCCLKCDREYHADYNAAKNIARKLLQNWHTSGAGGATSHLALKSGTLNVNGIFTPTTV
ncbi:transposase [Salinadaptatus halalkaliphilus]|uniref:Transposase n=1 Tax=Salinadaptatus halalkaliphilus TaxID=2419781 RepID=A0A4S3TIC9_9EURY|nr:transposase [Salinadaptatus halalkaliphilus]